MAMTQAYVDIGGKQYRLTLRKDYSVPMSYYFRRDGSKEIIFYNLSPNKRLERLIIDTILDIEGATKVGGLERRAKGNGHIEGVYVASVDPESYQVRELERLEGIPKVNGYVHPEILKKVLSQGLHVVSISGIERPKAKLFAPVDELANLFFGSPVKSKKLKMIQGVGRGQDPKDAIQEAYFNALLNAPYS